MIKKIIFSCVLPSLTYASGYSVFVTSLNSTALAFAYNATSHGADSAYYNPANISFNENKNYLEIDLHTIKLPSTEFTSNLNPIFDTNSEKETFYIPTLHFSSKKMNNFRYGLSITSPFGLSKRWEGILPKASAEEFTLKTIEINPSISYKLSQNLAIGAGIRFTKASGVIKSNSMPLHALNPLVPSTQRIMQGDGIAFAYNLALSYKVNQDLQFALTYRSAQDIKIKGDAKLFLDNNLIYDDLAYVYAHIPALLNISLAYKPYTHTTLEFTYNKSFWHKYSQTDFTYVSPQIIFDSPNIVSWKDSNTYAIGITHTYSKNIKLMLGFALDNTPVPSETSGFNLPDSDAKLYSCGFEYFINTQHSVGSALLYNDKKDRNTLGLNGTTHSSAYDLVLAYKYNF